MPTLSRCEKFWRTTTGSSTSGHPSGRILEDDDRLINIRTSIREASESQLRNGTLLISDLLKDINDEHRARIDKSIHELEYLKKLYKMKYTLNY